MVISVDKPSQLSVQTNLGQDCDICIVGTGAAGGILAYRLAQANVRVISLEQGAPIDSSYFSNQKNPEQEANFGVSPQMHWPFQPAESYYYDNFQASQLYAQADTQSTTPASATQFDNRQIFRLNGKQNLWGGVCLRFSERDFRAKDYGDSESNWPITYADLAPHYSEIERLIGVCGTQEGLETMPDGEYLPAKPLRPADRILQTAVQSIRDLKIQAIPSRKAIETRPEVAHHCQSCGICAYGCQSGSIYKFSTHLLPKIQNRPNYRIIYHTKVVRLERQEHGSAIQQVECLNTQTGKRFQVRAKVFILAAGGLETPRILFNSKDDQFPHGYGNRSGLLGCYLQDNVLVNLGTSLVKLMGNRADYDVGFGDNMLIPRFLFDNRDFRGGYMSLFYNSFPRRPNYIDGLDLFPNWSKKPLAKLLFRSYAVLHMQGKPEAVKSNRLTPSTTPDAYGIPQVDVHYQATKNDQKMQQSMIAQGTRILRRCSGLLIFTYQLKPGNNIHYAGTCRMADQPNQGIVDVNLQTFDHANLFLCDGSVLPEISEKNYTLTIMALADRLANYLTQNYLPRTQRISLSIPSSLPRYQP